MLFLQETKFSLEYLQTIKGKFWSGIQVVAIDANRVARGLAMIWRPEMLQISNFRETRCSISAYFWAVISEETGTLTNVYGPNISTQKPPFL